MTVDAVLHQPDEVLLGFARALRAAGVPVTLDRSRAWLEAASLVDLGDRQATYWAGRATLCSCPDDLARFDQVFDAWFLSREGLPRTQKPATRIDLAQADLPDAEQEDGAGDDDPDTVAARASATEVLRHRDIAEVTGAQKATLAAMFGALHPTAPERRADDSPR